MTLLKRLADPNLLEKMTASEKITAALHATILGMGITFAALIIIWGLTVVLKKVVNSIENKGDTQIKVIKTKVNNKIEIEEAYEENNDEELIAVISAAIASSLKTSVDNIIVRNIVRVADDTPTWGVVARINQINSRL
ncbi:MAG: OadG family protein [Bacillota bacterium]|nr:OadG family protein [Bacillota bacterium]